MIVVHGETLWSHASQPMDDDDHKKMMVRYRLVEWHVYSIQIYTAMISALSMS